MLQVEDQARKHHWKHVDLAKWKNAGLDRPVLLPTLPPERAKPLSALKPKSVVVRITERQAKLLMLFERADEQGKKIVEAAASAAASRPIMKASQNREVNAKSQ